MPSQDAHPLFDRLAREMRSRADDLTDRWLEALGKRLGVRPRRLLPTQELRDHIPIVLSSAAQYLVLPTSQLPNQAVDVLRTLAQLRREQGYDVQEIVLEFEVLGDLVFEWTADWVDQMDDAPPAGAAVRVAARLASALRQITTVAVGTYREEELRHEQELSDRLSTFAGTVAHELTNPLHTAGLSLELLSEESVAEDPEKRQRHLAVIRDRISRLHHLVDDVRALAVAEGAMGQSRWRTLRDVFQTVLEEVRDAAERHEVTVELEEPVDGFDVDAVRVEIALMNLVLNAIKFSDPEKEERWVRVSAGPAELDGLEGGRRISVADNGRGIPPESHNKVFQRFFRAIPEIEGTGMGLEITKRVVEQRGGRLWFESELGEGTTFHLEIPPRLANSEKQPGDAER